MDKVIMVVGATGAGKSTLIDGMINYALGVQLRDPFRYKLIDLLYDEKEKVSKQNESQTEYITAYNIPKLKGSPVDHSLTIIDTPGFGDHRGIERDQQITEQIKHLFTAPEGIMSLNAVCFVTQAPLARLTPTQTYVFNSILSVFGKDIGGNIMVMITFADGARPPVFAALDAAKLPYKNAYKFNNSALYEDNKEATSDQFLQLFWKMGQSSFQKFFVGLATLPARSLTLTKEVLKEREQLEITVQGLRQQIQEGLAQMDTLEQEQQMLEQRKAEMKENKDFTYTVKTPTSTRIENPAGVYVTNCMKCNRTCHGNCAFPNDSDKASCAVMRNGNCTVCPKKCYWSSHVNQSFKYELHEIVEKRTYKDLENRYLQAESGHNEKMSVVQGLKNHWEKLSKRVIEMMSQVRCSLMRLDQIALRPSPMTNVEYMELLIEAERSEAKSGFLRRIQVLEALKNEAELMRKVQNPDYNPFKAASKQF